MGKKVIVIGGGAAGMFAGVIAARNGAEVTIFEKNSRLGKKLAITGKGRCNVTNNCDIETLIANIPQNPRFLYGVFSRFAPQDAINFFEDLGVRLKTERGARVFPISDQAEEIVCALTDELKRLNVKIVHTSVDALVCDNNCATGVNVNGKLYLADSIILATGGMSYPGTGSTGDGYRMAEEMGHTVVEPRASLVPLIAESKICAEMQGLSLKNVTVSVYENDSKCIFKELGEMLFTHFGMSGPLILSASAHMRNIDRKRYTVKIDLKPGLDKVKLNARILRDFDERKNQDISNALRALLPAKLIPVVLKKSEIPFDTKVHSVDKSARNRLVEVLKGLEFKVDAFRPISEAIITSGGIKVSEIDPKTMMSKKINGLYFAGEIIDSDAYTGGFNLQIAWSTAFVAAQEAGTDK